jgi:hypothetical protein
MHVATILNFEGSSAVTVAEIRLMDANIIWKRRTIEKVYHDMYIYHL